MKKIILASGSPRRKELLELAGLNFEVIINSIDESYPAGLSPLEVPIHIAKEKAWAVKNSYPDKSKSIIIAADTIVVLNNEIFGKPKDRADAIQMLQKLSGHTHSVITGVCLLSDGEINFYSITEVTFLDLTSQQIAWYVDHYNPLDKAGAYAIQEWIGLTGIKSISGDYYNVVGLPVSQLLQELKNI
ncbi:MAG: septum formation protein Maf [Bacteroidetes bacterium]|nr:septum formation protein Maf [Bacteroidota bacterium]